MKTQAKTKQDPTLSPSTVHLVDHILAENQKWRRGHFPVDLETRAHWMSSDFLRRCNPAERRAVLAALTTDDPRLVAFLLENIPAHIPEGFANDYKKMRIRAKIDEHYAAGDSVVVRIKTGTRHSGDCVWAYIYHHDGKTGEDDFRFSAYFSNDPDLLPEDIGNPDKKIRYANLYLSEIDSIYTARGFELIFAVKQAADNYAKKDQTCRKCGRVNPVVYFAPVNVYDHRTVICYNCASERGWVNRSTGSLKEGIEL